MKAKENTSNFIHLLKIAHKREPWSLNVLDKFIHKYTVIFLKKYDK